MVREGLVDRFGSGKGKAAAYEVRVEPIPGSGEPVPVIEPAARLCRCHRCNLAGSGRVPADAMRLMGVEDFACMPEAQPGANLICARWNQLLDADGGEGAAGPATGKS
jgi:hypothetical protein